MRSALAEKDLQVNNLMDFSKRIFSKIFEKLVPSDFKLLFILLSETLKCEAKSLSDGI